MVHVLGIDENFERPPPSVLDHVVDGDVNGMVRFRPFEFIGLARQFAGAVERLGHVDHAAGLELVLGPRRRRIQGKLFLVRVTHILIADFSIGSSARRFQNRTGDFVGTVSGAALAAGIVGVQVDLLEILERNIRGNIDGFGNGTVHVFLGGGLHDDVIVWRKPLGIGEIRRQFRPFTECPSVQAVGVIAHLFVTPGAVGLHHVAGIGEGEHRFQPR